MRISEKVARTLALNYAIAEYKVPAGEIEIINSNFVTKEKEPYESYAVLMNISGNVEHLLCVDAKTQEVSVIY